MPTQHFEKLKIDRKNAIIKAATREFATKDYSEVSVRDIADKADISRGSFYLYFKDKEDCYLTVIDAYKYRLEQGLLNIYLRAPNITEVVLQAFDYFTHLSAFEQGLFEHIGNNLNTEVQDMILNAFDKFGNTINEHLEGNLREHGIEITPEIQENLVLRHEILFSLLLTAIVEISIGRTALEDVRKALAKKVDIVINSIGEIYPNSLENNEKME